MTFEIRPQAVAGLMTPEHGEARMREAYPSVAAHFAVATLGKRLIQSIFLAPVGWVVMAWPYFSKVLLVFGRKYVLTNRRVMIRAGWKGTVIGEVALGNIDEVRLVRDGNSDFFRAATLELIHDGKVALHLPGVPEPDSFREAILNARNAWVPGKSKSIPFISAATK